MQSNRFRIVDTQKEARSSSCEIKKTCCVRDQSEQINRFRIVYLQKRGLNSKICVELHLNWIDKYLIKSCIIKFLHTAQNILMYRFGIHWVLPAEAVKKFM